MDRNHRIGRIVSTPATATALAGFSATCSCGATIRYSLRGMVEREVAAHAAWARGLASWAR